MVGVVPRPVQPGTKMQTGIRSTRGKPDQRRPLSTPVRRSPLPCCDCRLFCVLAVARAVVLAAVVVVVVLVVLSGQLLARKPVRIAVRICNRRAAASGRADEQRRLSQRQRHSAADGDLAGLGDAGPTGQDAQGLTLAGT